MPIPKTDDDKSRAIAVMFGAAIILHADISARGIPTKHDQNESTAEGRISAAFDLSEKFVLETEHRFGSIKELGT